MDMHRQASKHKQSHAMYTHTHARDTVRCAPLELLSILFPPLPALHLLFHSIFVLYPNNSSRRTLDGTPNKCLNIYFYINRNNFWVFLVCYSLFLIVFIIHLFLCVRVSFVRWLSFHFCAARLLRFAPLSLSLSRSLALYKLYFIDLPKYTAKHTHTLTEYCCFSSYVLDQQLTDLSHVSRFVKISVKISIIL